MPGPGESLTRMALVLAAGNLVTRAAGLCYRVLLARWLGGEGLGLFQLALSLYFAVVQPFVGSLPSALAQVLARHRGRLGPGAAERRVLAQVVLASLAIVVLVSAVLAALPAGRLPDAWRAALGLLPLPLLGATLACAVTAAALRGLLLAYGQARPIAAGQLVEQLVRAAVLAVLGWAATGTAITLGSRLGVAFWLLALGEAADLLVLAWALRALLAQPEALRPPPSQPQLAGVVRMALPVALQRGFFSLEHLLEATLIPQLLRRSGLGLGQALAVYGALGGIAGALLQLPMVAVGALGQALVPGVAASLGDPERIHRRVSRGLQAAAELGAFAALVFHFAGPELGRWLFGPADPRAGDLAAELVQLLAPAALFLYVDATTAAVLRGLGRPVAPLLVDVAAALLRFGLLLAWAGTPGQGLRGLAAAVVVGVAVACTLDLVLVFRFTGLPARLLPELAAPAAGALAALALASSLPTPPAARAAVALGLHGLARLAWHARAGRASG